MSGYEIALVCYAAGGLFTAGVSFAVAWYERCHDKHDAIDWIVLVLTSFLLWPQALILFFCYSSGAGCNGTGVHQ